MNVQAKQQQEQSLWAEQQTEKQRGPRQPVALEIVVVVRGESARQLPRPNRHQPSFCEALALALLVVVVVARPGQTQGIALQLKPVLAQAQEQEQKQQQQTAAAAQQRVQIAAAE